MSASAKSRPARCVDRQCDDALVFNTEHQVVENTQDVVVADAWRWWQRCNNAENRGGFRAQAASLITLRLFRCFSANHRSYWTC